MQISCSTERKMSALPRDQKARLIPLIQKVRLKNMTLSVPLKFNSQSSSFRIVYNCAKIVDTLFYIFVEKKLILN